MAIVGLIHRNLDAESVKNTTTETEVFSYTLPEDFLRDGQMVRVGIRGLILQGTGSSQQFHVKLEASDGTTTETRAINTNDMDAGNMNLKADWEVIAGGSSSQHAFGMIHLGAGNDSDKVSVNGKLSTDWTLDSSKEITFKVYYQPLYASNSFEMRKDIAIVEIL